MKLLMKSMLIIGLGMLLWALYLYLSTSDFLKHAITTTGTVVENRYEKNSNNDRGSYRQYVLFKTQDGKGVYLKAKVKTNPPSFKINDEVKIYYDKDNPENALIGSITELWFGPILIGALGAIITSIPATLLFFINRKKRRDAWLKVNGERILAKYTGCIVDQSVTIQGRNPHLVTAQWLDTRTNTLYLFKSHRIWYNPDEFITEITLPVYIDRTNPKKYFMDLSFLPAA